MSRYPAVDPDAVLDAAERLLRTQGSAALTIAAVAKAAGISKGGVQSRFGTKDQLIDAMLARWERDFDEQVATEAGPAPTPAQQLRAHVNVTRLTAPAEHDRSAALMAALIHAPAHLAGCQAWYATRLQGHDMSTPEGRRARLVFLATEGAFLLHSFGFMRQESAEWDAMFADILGWLDDPACGVPGTPGAALQSGQPSADRS